MKEKNINISCGDFCDIKELDNGKLSSKGHIRKCKKESRLNYLLKDNYILFQTVLVHESLKDSIVFENINHEDFVLAIDLINKGIIIYGINKILCFRRRRNESLTSSKIRSANWRWNVYRTHLDLNLFVSIWYLLCYFTISVYFNYVKRRVFYENS